MIFVTAKTTITRKCSSGVEALAGIGKLVRMPTPFLLRVALPVPLPRLFDYLPPDGHAPSQADVGRRVKVPFGSRELTGIVAEVGASADTTPELRQVTAFLDATPLLQGELLESLRWLSRYTHAPLGEVLGIGAARAAAPRRANARHPCMGVAADHARREMKWSVCARARGHVAWPNCCQVSARDEDSLDLHLDDWRSAARALAKRGLGRTRGDPRINAGACAAARSSAQPRNSNPPSTRFFPAKASQRCCWMVSPAAARPRSTCTPSPTACVAASRRWCWCRKSD